MKHILLLKLLIWAYTSKNIFCTQIGSSTIDNHQTQTTNLSFRCSQYKSTIITEKDKFTILNKINSRRNKVALGEIRSLPAAENMRRLVWNDKLAELAFRLAEDCTKRKHFDKSDVESNGDINYGTTVSYIYGDSPGLTMSSLVDIWYMELLNTNSSIMASYKPSNEASQHYSYFTQLMWAETQQVGCGGVKFIEEDQRQNITVHRLVCNFYPKGNTIGESVYKFGEKCANCSDEEKCDLIYKGLCDVNATKISTLTDFNKQILSSASLENKTIKIQKDDIASVTIADDSSTENLHYPFNYFSTNDYTRSLLIVPTTQFSCQHSMELDDLVEVLKKKLSTDPAFKDLLITTPKKENTEADDASVVEFASNIYSKKTMPTSTKMPDEEQVNSTLLVDLVEAVIFRNADKTHLPIENFLENNMQTILEVGPVKIKAELPVTQVNNDFTGHYFFPEDEDSAEEDENESNIETTDSYYDSSFAQAEDIVRQLDNLKLERSTNSFLDDILDSESVKEITSTSASTLMSPDNLTVHKNGYINMKKFLEEIAVRH